MNDTIPKTESRIQKLELLKAMRVASMKANKNEVIQADIKPVKESQKLKRKKAAAEELIARQSITSLGLDQERMKNLEYSIDDAERWNEKLATKDDKFDQGFSDYTQIQAKKYHKMINDFTPDLTNYSDAFDSLNYIDHKPLPINVNKLVGEIEKQSKKRGVYSKRRKHDETKEVTFINDRNERFNAKVGRAYDKYTTEIKANFERGTAL